MTTEIPQEIKDRIEAEAETKRVYGEKYPIGDSSGYRSMLFYQVSDVAEQYFSDGAEYGYSLSLPALTERDELKSEMQMKVDYYEDKIEMQIRIAEEIYNETEVLKRDLQLTYEQLKIDKQEMDELIKEVERLKSLMNELYIVAYDDGINHTRSYAKFCKENSIT